MKAKRIKGLEPTMPLGEGAARIVKVRLAELRGFAPAALEADAAVAQHNMRIAAKRLRYVLEATGFCLGPSAEVARLRATDLQDLLGEIHDADVMMPRLAQHRAQLRDRDATAVRRMAADSDDLDPSLAGRAPHRTAYRGLEIFEVYLIARRGLLFERFLETWESLEKHRVWDRLERVADDLLVDAN